MIWPRSSTPQARPAVPRDANSPTATCSPAPATPSQGALADIFDMSGSSTLLFLPLAHSFARIIEVGCLESGAILMHWPDASTVAKGLPQTSPSFLLAVPRVFEKVYQLSAAAGLSQRGQEQDLHGGGRHCRRLQPGATPISDWPAGQARGSGSATRSSTGSSTASSGPPSAARSNSPYPAARRSGTGSVISSVARALPCLRATA